MPIVDPPPPPRVYSDDGDRLKWAQWLWDRMAATINNDQARTQMIAGIQVALAEAYEQGQRMSAARLDNPPMRLTLKWRRGSRRHHRAIPFVVDDLGREMPGLFAVNLNDEVDEVPEIHLGLCVDGDRVAVWPRAGEDDTDGT